MPNVVSLGEALLEIIFLNNQPLKAIAGGSVLNTAVSLGRAGTHAVFSSAAGNDHAGNFVVNFLKENGIDVTCFHLLENRQTPVSLAFLNDDGNAEYQFYRAYAPEIHDYSLPKIHKDDIIFIGSWFAVNPMNTSILLPYLQWAVSHGASLFYDLNFRKNHLKDLEKCKPAILEILRLASIIKASKEDLELVFGTEDPETLFDEIITDAGTIVIKTSGKDAITIRSKSINMEVSVAPLQAVSTIGAGDSFNAGVIHYFSKNNIQQKDRISLPEEEWRKIIGCGIQFSREVCLSTENYVPPNFTAGE